MKKNFAMLVGLFLAVAGLNAQAADLRVKGYIAPVSCSFTITNATIDYGSINPNSLSATAPTHLPAKSTPYAVKCGGSAKALIALKATDNRVGSSIASPIPTYSYGLGTTAQGKKIGSYLVLTRNTVVDGKAGLPITSTDNGKTWHRGSSEYLGPAPATLATWHTGSYGPIPVNTVSGTLEVRPTINKTSELDLNSQVSLDGHATLELRYL